MSQQTDPKEIISSFLDNNILVSDDILVSGSLSTIDDIKSLVEKKITDKQFLILNNDILNHINTNPLLSLNWLDMERYRVLFEKGINSNLYKNFLELASKEPSKIQPSIEKPQITGDFPVNVISSFEEDPQKRNVQDFVSYFNKRYHAIKGLLEQRQELQNITSIGRLVNKRDKNNISIIGLVSSKSLTSNQNLVLTLEDPSGSIKVIVSKNKPEVFNIAKSLVNDEVIGIVGANGDNVVFANNVLLPDVPVSKELKKCNDETYAIFLSDVHVGSKQFLEEEFQKFLNWIKGEVGSEAQQEVARKVKYIFIVGDLVDGVGIYPNQDTELDIKDIYQQYKAFTEYIKQIPSDKKIIICPGNHDSQRLAEPQPKLDAKYLGELADLPNVTHLSNPSYVNIHQSENFPGFDVLLYHGYSFDYYISNIDYIREAGGYDRADLIMKFLLQRRHLSPSHTATLYIPDREKDPLVIDKVPDFFITGHIHKSSAAMYRNVTLISGSCWQSKTSFQEKVGHNPEPARVPLVNLNTRQVKILRF